MLGAIILGISGGLIGAFFIIINNFVNKIRKRFLKYPWLKIVESLVLVLLTVTTMYLAAYIKYESAENPDDNVEICQNIR